MKITRNLLLVCLALSISAFGQFGKLGDLAKKAKQKPNSNVQRQGGGTPEATSDIKDITGGETKVVTVTITNGDANKFNADTSSSCLKVDKLEHVDESHLKLTVYADEHASDGHCNISLKDDKGNYLGADLMVHHKKQVGEDFRPEQVSVDQAFASQWIIKMPNGTTNTLTRGKQVAGGGYEYKDSNGKWYTTMYMGTMIMFGGSYGNQCTYQAMANSKHEGIFMVASNACGFAIGQKLEATSK